MIRQVYIFYKEERIFNYSYAIGFSDDDLSNVKKIIQSYLEMPVYNKIFQHPISEKYQIFHKSEKQCLLLIITDLTEQIEYIKGFINRILSTFYELFPNPHDINIEIEKKEKFNNFLKELQYELHSKITIIGPFNAGKTILYNLLKTGTEKPIMNFAKSSILVLDNLKFDLWDFQLNDNFSLLWSKFLSGSDLIIFIFDLSNYHLKVIDHFLSLIKKEGKFSKLLILGNKRELVEDIDIKRVKNEIGLPNLEEISLISPDSKEKMIFLISKALQLRELLPSTFKDLMKDAINTENEEKLALAIAKYKELIKICNQYQDFTYIDTFKRKVEELQNKFDVKVEQKRKEDRKKKFEIPGRIVFTKKVQVKPLPTSIDEIDSPVLGIPPAPKMEFHERETIKSVEGLKLFSKEDRDQQEEKDVVTPIAAKSDFKVISSFGSKSSVEASSEISNFPKTLKNLIEQKGSSLSLKLCEQLVKELQSTLARSITIEDIKMAAEVFVKQEISTN